jgi:hypothetical protein
VTKEIETKTTHYADKDVQDITTTEYTETSTWNETDSSTTTDTYTEG